MEIDPQAQTEIGRNPLSQCYIIKYSIASFRTERVKSGLFSHDDLFVVETLPFKYVTRRSNNDFLWLREKLFADFPGIYVKYC